MPCAAGPGLSAAILGCEDIAISHYEKEFFRDANPLGFILFARNVDSPDQLRRLTGELRASVGRDAPILIDQEGGRVQRLRAPHWREWLAPLDQVARTASPGAMERAVWLRYRLIAAELRAVGIDANCAPCADIAGPHTHPFLRNRCFGSDPQTVIRAARAAAEGLRAGGVLAAVKHLPGHGRATLDSHKQLPRVTAGMDELTRTDFAPFASLADLPMALTAHIIFEAIDPDRPATASARVIAHIRERIGFEGLLISDDLSMQALSGGIGARAGAAIAAGCDIALHCNANRAEMVETVSAAGPLGEAAAGRVARALQGRQEPQAIDTGLLEAEFEALVKEPERG